MLTFIPCFYFGKKEPASFKYISTFICIICTMSLLFYSLKVKQKWNLSLCSVFITTTSVMCFCDNRKKTIKSWITIMYMTINYHTLFSVKRLWKGCICWAWRRKSIVKITPIHLNSEVYTTSSHTASHWKIYSCWKRS